MTPNTNLQSHLQDGFGSLVNRRAAMQQWSALSHLSSLRKNQEATEIVASFQIQMEVESTTSTPFGDKVA